MKEAEATIRVKSLINSENIFAKTNISTEIQKKIDELRSAVTNCSFLADEHKHRLLQALNELQSEFDNPTSNFDLILGKISKVGIILGKFGKDAKPFMDLLKPIWKLVEKAIDFPELPSSGSVPALPPFGQDEE